VQRSLFKPENAKACAIPKPVHGKQEHYMSPAVADLATTTRGIASPIFFCAAAAIPPTMSAISTKSKTRLNYPDWCSFLPLATISRLVKFTLNSQWCQRR